MSDIEDIQIFGMNMPFISSSEAKNAYFMSGGATNEIYIFSLHEKSFAETFTFSTYIYHFKRNRFLAVNDVIHVRTLRHINNDVA